MIKWFLIYFKYWNRIFSIGMSDFVIQEFPKVTVPYIVCIILYFLYKIYITALIKKKYVRFHIPSLLIRPNVNIEPPPYDIYIVPLNIFDVRCSQGYIENKKY